MVMNSCPTGGVTQVRPWAFAKKMFCERSTTSEIGARIGSTRYISQTHDGFKSVFLILNRRPPRVTATALVTPWHGSSAEEPQRAPKGLEDAHGSIVLLRRS